MNRPNQAQVAAAGRHVLSFSMGAVTMAATLNLISGGDASTISNSLTQISSGIAQIAAGLAPLIGIATAFYASYTSSHTAQIAAVNALPGVKVVASTAQAQTVTAPVK